MEALATLLSISVRNLLVGHAEGGRKGGSPPMLKVHIRPLVNLPERGGFRSRVRGVSDVVIGRREISRAQLIGKSTEGGKEGIGGKTGIQIMEKEENSIWKKNEGRR